MKNKLFIVLLLFVLFIFCVVVYNIRYIENYENDTIPKNIFQTWHTKNLPPKMQNCVNELTHRNPEFKFYLYDDNDCREFIQNNYDSDILYAFDNLKPGAYKADLWRYCILYKYGGIYLDIKYQSVNKFKFIQLTDKEYFVKDANYDSNDDLIKPKNGIYNALIICKAKNEIIFKCITDIVDNVKNKFYGYHPLEVTGPLLLKKYIDSNALTLSHAIENNNYYIIDSNNTKILKMYNGYFEERHNYQKNKHYGDLWKERDIYIL